MKKITGILFLAAVLFAPSVFAMNAQDADLFQKANQAYRKGDFKNAGDSYELLAGKYPDESVFFYNLGNSLQRQGKIGPTLVAYEQALALDPRNQDIRANLKYTRGLVQYRVEDKRNWYLKAAQEALDYFTEREVVSVVLLTYFLLATSWAFVLFFKNGAEWGFKRRILLLISAVFFLIGLGKNIETHFIRDAIVTANEAAVRYGPSEADKVAFRVGEGIKVYVVDKREEWSRVLMCNGGSGWIPNTQITEIAK